MNAPRWTRSTSAPARRRAWTASASQFVPAERRTTALTVVIGAPLAASSPSSRTVPQRRRERLAQRLDRLVDRRRVAQSADHEATAVDDAADLRVRDARHRRGERGDVLLAHL